MAHRDVIASQHILLDSLREQGVQLAEPVGGDERLELEVVRVLRRDGPIAYEYGVSAIRNGVRVNVLADLTGEEHARNVNRLSTLFATACAAFGPPPSRQRKLQEIDPEQFALALIEMCKEMLIRLGALLYPYREVMGITGIDAGKTRLFSQAVTIGEYARTGRLPSDRDEDDVFQQWHDTVSLLFVAGPLKRSRIVGPLDSMGALHCTTEAALLVYVVLIGALVRLQLSKHEYQHDTSAFFAPTSSVTLVELGLLAGRTPQEILNDKAEKLGALRDIVATDMPESAVIPRDLARAWLREQGVPGF